MRYTVVWLKDAEEQLIELWSTADDREAVSKASHQVDRLLATDAPRRGELLQEEMRALEVAPLRVIFSIREADRIVEIALVRVI